MEKYLFNSFAEFVAFIYSPPQELQDHLSTDDAIESVFNISLLNKDGQTYEEYIEGLGEDEPENFVTVGKIKTNPHSQIPESYPCLMLAFTAPRPANSKDIDYYFIYPSDFNEIS